MKHRLSYLFTLVVIILACATSCYDDYQLNERIKYIDSRVAVLEQLIDAQSSHESVLSMNKTDNGYEITFSSHKKVLLINGSNGDAGPKGDDGASYFSSFNYDQESISFTLVSGESFTFPMFKSLEIFFDEGDMAIMRENSSREIGFEVSESSENTFIHVFSSGGIKSRLLYLQGKKGRILVETGPIIDECSKIVIIVGDGNRSLMKSLAFEASSIMVKDESTIDISYKARQLNLSYLSNVNCHVSIEEEAQSWISLIATKAMDEHVITIDVSENKGRERSGVIHVCSDDGLELSYVINQDFDVDSIKELERNTLQAIFTALNGDKWADSSNWCSDVPVSQWYGVQVNERGFVTGLELDNNNLGGYIPSTVSKLAYLENLRVNGNRIGGSLPSSLGKMASLLTFIADNNNIGGGIPESFGESRLDVFKVNGNRLTGPIPVSVYSNPKWSGWNPDTNIFPQQDGYRLYIGIYQSTDFSSDGNVIIVQTHEEGKGIPFIIMGDAFVDLDVDNGRYDDVVRNAVEHIFDVEPYKSFRQYFDVYSVTAVSRYNEVSRETAFECRFGSGTLIEGDLDKICDYANLAIDDISDATVMVIINDNRYAGTCYYLDYPYSGRPVEGDYGKGLTIAFVPLGTDDEMHAQLIHHEFGGHGFGKLDDEYSYEHMGRVPSSEISNYRVQWACGYFLNTDCVNNPDKVRWSYFLKDERYRGQGLGLFEGSGTYWSGLWRPTENSIMRYNVGVYNAPSREAIYRRMHICAFGEEWNYSFEEFVKYDEINRNDSIQAGSMYSHFDKDSFIPLHPPVFVNISR